MDDWLKEAGWTCREGRVVRWTEKAKIDGQIEGGHR